MRALTHAGWVAGTAHVPVKSRFRDFLEHGREYIALTDVEVEYKKERIPFFALHASAIVFVLPGADELEETLEPHDVRPTTPQTIDCLLRSGHIVGSIDVAQRVRVSYQLSHGPRFIAIQDAKARLRDPWTGAIIELEAKVMLLNGREVVGVSELDA